MFPYLYPVTHLKKEVGHTADGMAGGLQCSPGEPRTPVGQGEGEPNMKTFVSEPWCQGTVLTLVPLSYPGKQTRGRGEGHPR